MKTEIKMPKLGESLTEGTVLKWWKKVGDSVKKDETLLEIATDKVDSEIPSPADGILVEILAKENETVAVGQIIAYIETDHSASLLSPEKSLSKKEKTEKLKKAKDEKAFSIHPAVKLSQPVVEKKQEKNRFYSPLVMNIARKESISMSELEKIPGSGAGNRVSKKDILNYLQSKSGKPSAVISSSGKEKGIEFIPMDHVRKQIAMHMRQSLETSAHVYSVSECDMTGVMNLINTHREQFMNQEGFKLTITPFVLYAVARALKDFPMVNSSIEGENIIQKKDINLGIAVAASRGLIVPVIHNAEEKNFIGIARALNEIVIKARENKLTLKDIEGSTFTITNYGIFGNIIGLPIIHQPNVAILGIGAIKKRPVVLEHPGGDSIGIRSMTLISMSYDHRLVDGELGGKFMRQVVEYLENFKEKIL
jgi:2-oxoglutarate dehydrogenase E2 component (dihydrolipoamide succinyltransferase)